MKPETILIVEDEQITAMELQSMLEEMDYEVLGVVDTGEKVLVQMREEPPDLILMDIRLPGEMDGIEIAREIDKSYSIPIIYLTAHSDAETLERAKQTQPAGYLTKPVTEEDLKTTLQIVLHNQQSEPR